MLSANKNSGLTGTQITDKKQAILN